MLAILLAYFIITNKKHIYIYTSNNKAPLSKYKSSNSDVYIPFIHDGERYSPFL